MADTALSHIIDGMRSPAFYPHETAESIPVLQTHISFVVLTGPFVYKLKKPVNLGFLDFSTLDKRHHFCNEELRLNRRFAPEIYLEVVPIYQVDNAFSLKSPNSGAEPVEFAVKMRQFAQDDLLLEQLRKGKLTESDMRTIAAQMAAFHATADTDTSAAQHASGPGIQEFVRNELDALREFAAASDSDQQKRFRSIEERLLAFVTEENATFDRRLSNGHIREGHGDLHLNNMCRFHGDICFFDCIEFSARLRNIDVMYELAFPVMDLRFRAAPQLANVLMNEYWERTGDYEGAVLLPFYVAMRGLVRAKVAAILSRDDNLDAAARAEAVRDAHEHLWLVDDTLKPRTGRLVLVCGVSGTGKSTVAREWAARESAIHIRSDAVRKHLHRVPLNDTRPDLYTAEATERTYQHLIGVAKPLLSKGWTVVLDATFLQRRYRLQAGDLARRLGVQFHIVHLTAPVNELRRRLTARKGDVSDADASLLDRQLAAFESFTEPESADLVEIDTSSAEIDTLLDQMSL